MMLEEERRLNPAVIADLLRTSMARGQRPHLKITSGSMRPLLQIGDEVQLEPVAYHELQPGDIITLAAPESLMTHRFWALKTGTSESEVCLITRGDRFLNFDSPWVQSLLVGKVVARRRHKRVLSLVEGSGGWLGRHVARIAAAENNLFHLDWRLAGQPLPTADLKKRTATTFFSLQVRRLIYLWVTLVVAFVSFISHKHKAG